MSVARAFNRSVFALLATLVITMEVSAQVQLSPPVARSVTISASAKVCDPAAVKTKLAALFEAISSGESGIARRFFAYGQEAPFQWYSLTQFHTGTKNHFVTYSRDSLEARFAQHQAARDRFTLHEVTFNGERDSAIHFGPVEFSFYDGAHSAPAGQGYPGTGKGAFHCPSQSFIVLSLATRKPQ